MSSAALTAEQSARQQPIVVQMEFALNHYGFDVYAEEDARTDISDHYLVLDVDGEEWTVQLYPGGKR